MSDLYDDLTDIDGVGEATADKILAVVEGHDSASGPYLDKAITAAQMGDNRTAALYLTRYAEGQ